jgi:hypothetical protein
MGFSFEESISPSNLVATAGGVSVDATVPTPLQPQSKNLVGTDLGSNGLHQPKDSLNLALLVKERLNIRATVHTHLNATNRFKEFGNELVCPRVVV